MKKNNTFIKKFILSLITNPDTNQTFFTKNTTKSPNRICIRYLPTHRNIGLLNPIRYTKKENVKPVQIR